MNDYFIGKTGEAKPKNYVSGDRAGITLNGGDFYKVERENMKTKKLVTQYIPKHDGELAKIIRIIVA